VLPQPPPTATLPTVTLFQVLTIVKLVCMLIATQPALQEYHRIKR
jgi:hypothetical protein